MNHFWGIIGAAGSGADGMSQMAGGVRPEGDESCRKHSSWGDPGDWRAGISHVWTALQTKAVSVSNHEGDRPG